MFCVVSPPILTISVSFFQESAVGCFKLLSLSTASARPGCQQLSISCPITLVLQASPLPGAASQPALAPSKVTQQIHHSHGFHPPLILSSEVWSCNLTCFSTETPSFDTCSQLLSSAVLSSKVRSLPVPCAEASYPPGTWVMNPF